jgi:signal transduction histidine kinase
VAQFRTRARTVDMLGRQQIAGIPTAISELFKNAHDAYADNALVDFFRSDRLFVLRDDGIGMTEDDFEQRWLTLGTESKAGLGGDLTPLATRQGYRRRAILGEKGIGRLAIAAIGPQVLMLSRSLRGETLGDLLVAYVHWGMFELPSANLEEVEIPAVTLPGGTLPGKQDVDTLVNWVADNLGNLAGTKERTLAKRIRAELENFRDIAPDELAATLGNPSLLDTPGTHFYMRPASELLADELDDHGDGTATPLRKTLVGFANTMTPEHREPALHTAFRDHYAEDAWEDVIDEAEFFTPDEFGAADHHIRGIFDEYGQFNGSVTVYRDEPVEHTIAWPKARGTPTRCGPFSFNLAYVQGNLRDSRLDPTLFGQISDKLNRYAGLYIYRDGIRVLPYGNSDFDFLDVELRRSKSADDAFFSYRRMFGVIELTRADNVELREKAGREGFADNEAYRQFRDILKNFLYQVAIDFFRRSGSYADAYWSERSELERLDKARQRRKGQIRVRRTELSDRLQDFFVAVEEDRPAQEVSQIVARLEGRIDTALELEDPARSAETLVEAETVARRDLQSLIDSYNIPRPRGVGLTRALTRDWAGYENERARLMEVVFNPALQAVEVGVTRAAEAHRLAVDRRVRFDSAVQAMAERSRVSARTGSRELEAAAKQARSHAHDLAQETTATIDGLVQRVLAQAASLDVSALSDTDYVGRRSGFEDELSTATAIRSRAIESVTAQLAGIVWPINGDGPLVTHLDQVEALETDVEELRERAEEDLELIQLGTAMSVINHEFEASINAMRRSLRRFEEWAGANPPLVAPYRDMRASFEHLDGYLRLFTPLNRRLYRKRVEIAGSEIEDFLRKVFDTRLTDTDVALVATSAFTKHGLEQYPSTVYPVFVNLVDNAIWWLAGYRGKREITLDAAKLQMSVRDTGPGVAERDRDSIFTSGFSRKPGGSGYGLYISREILQREGMDLELAPSSADVGAEFVIRENGPR